MLSRPRYRCEVKKSESEKWKWSESDVIFWSLIFLFSGKLKRGVLGNNNIGIKKCTTNFLWVLNFGQVGELPQQFSKSQYYGDFF